MVESSSDDILQDADKVDVAFLVVGDPFGYVYTVIQGIPAAYNWTAQPHIPT
jgi:precorrin-2 methylase